MKFPYGLADFPKIIREGYYYADRSGYIADLEDIGDQLLFLRPRRFGKSLLLGMLENYYDLAKAKDFESLFGQLAIGQNPTPRHNQYFVLRWDFSMVDSSGSLLDIKQALHDHLNACASSFKRYYADRLPQPIDSKEDNGLIALHSIVSTVRSLDKTLYLLIDEYDNFANEVMTARREDYPALVHGEGILKTLFKAVKGLSAGQGIDRVFITGVSPVVMSDVSSGYNVSKNISLQPEFYDLCGFRQSEIRAILQQVGDECGLSADNINQALDMMRIFYNGYCFGDEPSESLYNPTLALYFLEHFSRHCSYPRQMLDNNLAMDSNRIRYVGNLPHGAALIGKALNPQNPPVIDGWVDKFGMEAMLKPNKDQPFMASLLYYLGVLTVDKRDFMGRLVLRIPNLVIRRLYVERMQEVLLDTYESKEQVREAAHFFYHSGDLTPLIEFIETRYFKVFDNRDYRWSNELVIKTAFLISLFSDIFYIMDSETAIERGYADLSLIIRPDMRQYQLLDHLFEFKYISLPKLNLSGADLQTQSQAQLMQLPFVQEQLQQAEQQLAKHRQTLEQSYGDKLRLHTHAVVALGFERLLWRSS